MVIPSALTSSCITRNWKDRINLATTKHCNPTSNDFIQNNNDILERPLDNQNDHILLYCYKDLFFVLENLLTTDNFHYEYQLYHRVPVNQNGRNGNPEWNQSHLYFYMNFAQQPHFLFLFYLFHFLGDHFVLFVFAYRPQKRIILTVIHQE